MFATRPNSKQQFLPDLTNASHIDQHQKKIDIKPANQSNCCYKSKSQEGPRPSRSNSNTINLGPLPQLTPQLSNSALVHQRALAAPNSTTVGDHLAVASVQTGASLPLMIGNRPKCVVNLLDQQQQQPSQNQSQNQHQNNLNNPPPGPQNTALRAEQRRQNMSVSVVRPVVVVNSFSSAQGQGDGSASSKSSSSYSLIDDWMAFDRTYLNSGSGGGLKGGSATIDELLYSIKAADPMTTTIGDTSSPARQLKTEQERHHLLAMARREQHELNRQIRRQHQFMVDKLGERKRHLSIVQSVWFQRDFKHAIEKLVDIYHQGLIFTPNISNQLDQPQQQQSCKLKSLNTSLVVDVISIIILRPKLWTLEICQLLLPIINQDLLMQSQYEYYTEIGLKALKLILTHFSSIITSTLESLKESNKLVGIDLSREDRINKCLACYKLLLESHSVMTGQQKQQQSHNLNKQTTQSAPTTVGLSHLHNNDGQQCKLAAIQRELKAMFASLFNSIQLDSSVLARRFCG